MIWLYRLEVVTRIVVEAEQCVCSRLRRGRGIKIEAFFQAYVAAPSARA